MRIVVILLFCFTRHLGYSQNLVVNGGFEPASCPSTETDLSRVAPNWRDFFTSADHYGPCTFPGSATTNNNVVPHGGDGYIGLYGYGQFDLGFWNREYVIGDLTQTLEEGRRYRVSYFIHPVYVPQVDFNAGIAGPGILFYERLSDFVNPQFGLITSPSALHPENTITDLSQWTQVCIEFTAAGNERYIALGSFLPDYDLKMQPLRNGPVDLGYYLVDDLVVEPISNPVVPAEAGLCKNGELILTVPEGLSGIWEDGSTNTERIITQPGTYSYRYQDGHCPREDVVLVEEINCDKCNVYFPTTFTPNGDGLNDVWNPIFECDPEEYRLEIFDRQGNLVYRTYVMDEPWNPTSSQPIGTYVARLRFTYYLFGEKTTIDEVSEISILR